VHTFTNGTSSVALVKDIFTGSNPNGSSPQNFCVAGGNIFFTAQDQTHGSELWKSDGTAAGTVLVKDIRPGTSGGTPFI